MKKFIVVALMITSIIAFQNSSQAQEVGISDVIFEQDAIQTIEHNFLINDLSYTLIQLHLILAEKDIETINYEGETLATIKKLEELTKTDVINLLDISMNKAEALTKYLNECYQELQKWDAISAYMRQEMQILKSDMDACIVDKSTSDKVYFDAIDRYDQDMMEVSLNESIKYENCATENRIKYNAKTSVARKLVFYLWLLQQKYDVLSTKQEILAQNFTIFRDKILPDLNQINELLQQYKF